MHSNSPSNFKAILKIKNAVYDQLLTFKFHVCGEFLEAGNKNKGKAAKRTQRQQKECWQHLFRITDLRKCKRTDPILKSSTQAHFLNGSFVSSSNRSVILNLSFEGNLWRKRNSRKQPARQIGISDEEFRKVHDSNL